MTCETPRPANTSAATSTPRTVSPNATHATSTPTKGAVEKTSCPRVAPRSRAPDTHKVMDSP